MFGLDKIDKALCLFSTLIWTFQYGFMFGDRNQRISLLNLYGIPLFVSILISAVIWG
jgi:hypothetical protein